MTLDHPDKTVFFTITSFSALSTMMVCLPCLDRVKPFPVKILLLDKQEVVQEIEGATSGHDLLQAVFRHLNLVETAYFGLRYQDSTNQTVRKYEFIHRHCLNCE
jgi:hypothetical protein